MRPMLVSAALGAAMVGAVCGHEISFTGKPTVARDGDKVRITFAVSEPTDVEVAILSGTNVVRHLAAGVLGAKNPPPEPLQPGLAQELVWDGRDDFGRETPGFRVRGEPRIVSQSAASDGGNLAPFRVRVRAGTGVKFGRFIGNSPYLTSPPQAIACDEDGNLYIQYDGHIRIHDTEGRYLRELLPFPADMPPDAMKNIASWDAQAQAFHPRNTDALYPRFYGGGGKMVQASLKTGVFMVDDRLIYRLDPRGGISGDSLQSHDLWGGINKPGFPNGGRGGVWAALSPDGKYAYLSGPFTCKRGSTPLSPDAPPGRVYRAAMDGKDTWKEFATVKGAWDQDGVGGNYLKNMGFWDEYRGRRSPVQGVTVDTKGRVFVCDRENGRVVVFDETGKEMDEITIPFPEQVAVHPRTGAIYVLQRDRTTYWAIHAMLFKFDRLGKDVKPVATFKFDNQSQGPQMALAAGKDRTRIWVSGAWSATRLMVVEDKGASFEQVKTTFQIPEDLTTAWVRFAVDAGRDEVYVEDGAGLVHRWDGKTGEGGLLKKDGKPFRATDLSVGYDGLLYLQSGRSFNGQLNSGFSGPLERWTRDLQPAPYPSGTNVLSPYIYGRWGHGFNCEKGIGVGPHGEVYTSFMYSFARYLIGGFEPDGRPRQGLYMKDKYPATNARIETDPKKARNQYAPEMYGAGAIIGPIPDCNGGVRVDLAGNIYVGIAALPEGYVRPVGFEKDPAYGAVGSVIRFAPRGGAILGIQDAESKLPNAPRLAIANNAGKMIAEGATKIYEGIASFSGRWGSSSDCCVCRVPRFDLDCYGRVYLPNAILNSVRIVDNNDNLILEFGKYGNFDSQYVNPNTEAGPSTGSGHGKPTVAVPEIPLGWPTGVGASEAHVYVNDSYNNRAVRADLTYQAEEIVAVK